MQFFNKEMQKFTGDFYANIMKTKNFLDPILLEAKIAKYVK